MFWLIVVGVVSLSIGFVMGATFMQYRPVKKPKPHISADQAAKLVVQRLAREWEQKFQ